MFIEVCGNLIKEFFKWKYVVVPVFSVVQVIFWRMKKKYLEITMKHCSKLQFCFILNIFFSRTNRKISGILQSF